MMHLTDRHQICPKMWIEMLEYKHHLRQTSFDSNFTCVKRLTKVISNLAHEMYETKECIFLSILCETEESGLS